MIRLLRSADEAFALELEEGRAEGRHDGGDDAGGDGGGGGGGGGAARGGGEAHAAAMAAAAATPTPRATPPSAPPSRRRSRRPRRTRWRRSRRSGRRWGSGCAGWRRRWRRWGGAAQRHALQGALPRHPPARRRPHHSPHPNSASALSALPALATRLDDSLLQTALTPLSAPGGPERFAAVPTLAELSHRFEYVAPAARRAALVPDTAPGRWGHALAFVTSALTLRAAEAGHTATSVAIEEAASHLRKGHLPAAVAAVRTIVGDAAYATQGWLSAAEERMILDQWLMLATAEATVATAALAPF